MHKSIFHKPSKTKQIIMFKLGLGGSAKFEDFKEEICIS